MSLRRELLDFYYQERDRCNNTCYGKDRYGHYIIDSIKDREICRDILSAILACTLNNRGL